MRGVQLSHRFIVKPQVGHRAGPEVFDQDICAFDELGQDFLCRRMLEIQRKALLVAINGEEHGALPVEIGRAKAAGVIAAIWPFDFDHFRAHIPQ